MPASTQATPLLERDDQLATLSGHLDTASRGSGQLLVVQGEAGIGKSALLAEAARLARERGMRVLRATGSELEQLHSFAVAASLLAPLVRPSGRTVRLAPDNPARPVFGVGQDGSRGQPVDQLAVLHALQWLVIDATEPGPLALLVDDAHWVDEPSLRFLAALAHRVGSLPAAIVLATRPTADVAPEVFEQVRSHPHATRLEVPRLSRGAVDALLERVAPGALAHAVRDSIWEQAGGNPFYVVELVRASTSLQASIAGPVPDAIRASIRRRLAEAGGAAGAVAEAIAMLGDDAQLERVSALADVSADEATHVVRRMIGSGLLDTTHLAFTHPIVRTVVLEEIPPPVRPQLALAASHLLGAAGLPIAAAGHLLAVPPAASAAIVRLLHEGARAAAAQGDPAVARRLLVRALDEPPPPELRGEVLVDLGTAEASLGLPSAPDRYEAAVTHLATARARAQARLAQGHAYIQSARWREGASAFDAGLAEVDESDLELKSRLEAGFVSSAYVGLQDHDDASRRLERILGAPLDDPAHRELAAWSAFQQSLSIAASAAEATALARRAVHGVPLDPLVNASQAVELAAGVFVGAGELEEDVALLDEAMEVARRLGAHHKVGIYAYCRSLANLLKGRLSDAIADAETALSAHALGWEVFYPGTLASRAWAQLEQGNPSEAAAGLEMDDERWAQRLDYQFMVPIARGRVAAARGDHEGAVDQFDRVRSAGEAMGLSTPTVLGDWRTWCSVSLRQLGRRTEALTLAEESMELAERWGSALGLARAGWALGLVRGDADGIETLREARQLLSDHPARLELTRVTLDLGAALRRSGQLTEARELLRAAADLAHRLGIGGMLARAQEELQAAGARPRRYAVSGLESLTPSELRVARLVASGMTNREAAQSLFVTPKAVEYHLANAYRKLGIASRNEVAEALDREPADEVASV